MFCMKKMCDKRALGLAVFLAIALLIVIGSAVVAYGDDIIFVRGNAPLESAYYEYGTDGRLSIDELKITVPLYHKVAGETTTQDVVDAPYSACFMKWKSQVAIADHCTDGNMFHLAEAQVGMTASIEHKNGVSETYCCVEVTDGYVKDGRLYFADGSNLSCSEDLNAGGLCIYTCWVNQPSERLKEIGAQSFVTVTLWRPLSENKI